MRNTQTAIPQCRTPAPVDEIAEEPLLPAIAVNVFTHADAGPPPCAVPPVNVSPVAVGVAVATREDPPSFDAITTIRSPAFHATEAVDFEPLLFQVVSVYETRVGAPVGTPEVIAPVAELTVDAVPATASVSVTAPDATEVLLAVPARSHVVIAADGSISNRVRGTGW